MEKNEFKISKWDIRYAYIIDLETRKIEQLEAYSMTEMIESLNSF
ncbi:MAG: hypothetical protein ACTSRP_13210 [Candidatus Helarchaeota archaeon]